MGSRAIAVAIAVLGGCNRMFGLAPAIEVDAAYFDAPIDAPFACPPLGAAPAFKTLLHQHIFQDCSGYALSPSGRAAAWCTTGGIYGVYEGPADATLSPVEPLVTSMPSAGSTFDEPRLSPDGQRMLVRRFSRSPFIYTVEQYQRASDGSWTPLPAPPFRSAQTLQISTLVRTPAGDIVYLYYFFDSLIEEWIDEGGWRQLRSIAPASLGIPHFTSMTLTSDGTRALFSGTPGPGQRTLYADRPDPAASFGPLLEPAGIPDDAVDVTLADDCARIYVTGLGAVFYAQQL